MRKYEKLRCKVYLTEEEIRQAAETLAGKTQELDDVEAEKKASAAAYKERLERISGEIRTAARLYKDRYDMRDVECQVEKDYEVGLVRYIRTDTYETAKAEPMTMAERQRHVDEALPQPEEAQGEEVDAEFEREMQQAQTQSEMASERSAL
jgi:hypothetical protein